MKRKILSILLICLGLVAHAQIKFPNKIESKKGREIICPANHIDANTTVDMPEAVREAIENRKNLKPGAKTTKANFIVKYNDFPENAKVSFQRAIDIWAELISTPVDIYVDANYQKLGKNVLGSATTGNYFRNFPGAGKANTWYPVAIAEKMARRDINSPGDIDIVARFSSDVDWYFGTNKPAVGQYDFTSVVLHELAHGLGFIGSLDGEENAGEYGYGSLVPFVFDTFVENEKFQKLTDTTIFKNPSTNLKKELISDNLFFDSPIATKASGGVKPKLYAPTVFDQGSSISHLDDNTYNSSNLNSLMTSSASVREKIWNPGPITLGLFADMGWKSTSILHTPLKDIASVSKVQIQATVESDTTFDASNFKLYYASGTEDIKKPNVVNMVYNPSTKLYTGDIPVKNSKDSIRYYLSLKDNFNKTVTSPPNAEYYYYEFNVGKPDAAGPDIDYSAPDIVSANRAITFLANVEDDFQAGVDTVFVKYTLNGVEAPSFGLKKYNPLVDSKELSQGRADDVSYFNTTAISSLKSGDKVKFQIHARDKSGNTTILPTYYAGTTMEEKPAATFYEFTATTLKTASSSYSNNFDVANDDFATIGFSTSTITGFTSGSLHSSNPYKNGLGLLDPVSKRISIPFDGNEIAFLRVPITLKNSTDSAKIVFDEIVLVEPGETNSVFGDSEFYDYVVVEGSFDGTNWVPLEDGYDATKNSTWNSLFGSKLTTGSAPNSTATATPSLYKNHVVNIYGEDLTNDFAGEDLLIRFRLYSDQWSTGWGWSIDNLFIQKPAEKILANEQAINFDNAFKVYPNPSSDNMTINLTLESPQEVKVEIFNLRGQKYFDEKLISESKDFQKNITLKNYTTGTYFIRVITSEGARTKRFVIKR
jgi:hypothetical protein